MSELIGRFLSFEEHLGRGLVKAAYFVSLFFLLISHVYWVLRALITLHLGDAILFLCQGLLGVLLLRIVAELALALLSIEESVRQGQDREKGFEAGLTPRADVSRADVAQEAKVPPAPSSSDIETTSAPKDA